MLLLLVRTCTRSRAPAPGSADHGSAEQMARADRRPDRQTPRAKMHKGAGVDGGFTSAAGPKGWLLPPPPITPPRMIQGREAAASATPPATHTVPSHLKQVHPDHHHPPEHAQHEAHTHASPSRSELLMMIQRAADAAAGSTTML